MDVKTLWIPLFLWAGRGERSCFYGSKNLIPRGLCQASTYCLCVSNHKAAWGKFTEQLLHCIGTNTDLTSSLELTPASLHSPGKAHGCPSHIQFRDRQWDAHTVRSLHTTTEDGCILGLSKRGFSSFSSRHCFVPQQASGTIQYACNSYLPDTSGIQYS